MSLSQRQIANGRCRISRLNDIITKRVFSYFRVVGIQQSVIEVYLIDPYSLGLLLPKAIDDAVSRLFFVRMRLGEFDPKDHNPWRQIGIDQIRSQSHLTLAKLAAQQSLVLLRNRNVTLPLNVKASQTTEVRRTFID